MEKQKLAQKYASIGSAYSAVANAYYELSQAIEFDDEDMEEQIRQEIPAHKQILDLRTKGEEL